MKKIIIILAVLSAFTEVNAQQDAMFTHYMFNTLAVNPAYAGSRDALTVTGIHRSQWVGFDGAPVTQTITMHSPVFNENIGLGLSVVNDKIGPTNMTSFYGDFSYKIKVSETSTLAFGIKGGLSLRSNGLTSLDIGTVADDAFSSDQESKLLPNFGFGLYYSNDKYYLGLSTPRLLENDYATNDISGGTSLASEWRHYYFIAGTIMNLSKDIKMKPTTFVKLTSGAPVEFDLTSVFIWQDKFWAGPSFRSGDAAGLMMGVYFNNQFALGYSYDYSFGNRTFKYNGGSHEVMLTYDFFYKDKAKVRSPRYF